ncbi:ubiquitin carboxyl-terminal hydrolase 7 [Galendromus occidentalis]|uniref:ubiquitinyl hydrolase 1 n=1 Tax=Galendromus occidentalis TaxID=34638 RepID=A0AAJ6QTX4_9ACAR|nr:ubiquitin carboxyl-terminal hydrolase 7 [Galendromus occidentalis]
MEKLPLAENNDNHDGTRVSEDYWKTKELCRTAIKNLQTVCEALHVLKYLEPGEPADPEEIKRKFQYEWTSSVSSDGGVNYSQTFDFAFSATKNASDSLKTLSRELRGNNKAKSAEVNAKSLMTRFEQSKGEFMDIDARTSARKLVVGLLDHLRVRSVGGDQRYLAVPWINYDFTENRELTLFPKKSATVADLLHEAEGALHPGDLDIHHGSGKLRLLEIDAHLITKILPGTTNLRELDVTSKTLRIEEVPREQLEAVDNKRTALLPCAYYQPEICRTHGTPFLIKIYNDEPFQAVRDRIQERLKIVDDEFAKWRLFVISEGCVTYIQNPQEAVNVPELMRDCQGGFSAIPWLGLDSINMTPKTTRLHRQKKKKKPQNFLLIW